MKQYVELLKKLYEVTDKANIMIDDPMKNHTYFKVGGPADILVTPDDIK